MSARSALLTVPVFGADAPHEQVLDEDGHAVYLTEADARTLMLKGRATFIRKTKHIRGVRIIPTIVKEHQTPGSLHAKTLGDPHASDSLNNCVGVWTIEVCGRDPATSHTFMAMPKWATRELFSRPVVECLSAKAA